MTIIGNIELNNAIFLVKHKSIQQVRDDNVIIGAVRNVLDQLLHCSRCIYRSIVTLHLQIFVIKCEKT